MKKACLTLTVLLITFSVLSQKVEKKIALVIGNSAYEHSGPLRNPVNDAKLMAKTLKDVGFDVNVYTDASLQQMQKAALEFTDNIANYDVALFYYAGHGIQVNGINFLVPVDAKMETELSTKYEAFDINDINYAFAANNSNMNIMILDACRDNPFRSWSRGSNRGFKAIGNQAAGTIIAFATREGETASDGTGQNGLYTQMLVDQMKKKQSIIDVFQNTRVEVLKASENKQCPQEWNMLTGHFSFIEGGLNQNNNNNNNNVVVNVSSNNENTVVTGKGTPHSKTGLTMMGLPGGTFSMGSEENDEEGPIHEVTLKSFTISTTEVTNEQYCKFLNEKGNTTLGSIQCVDIASKDCRIEKKGDKFQAKPGFEKHPVIEVTWYGAKAYCQWAGGRLPTEAEWEYAARANTDTKYAGGNSIEEVAWYTENSFDKTQDVAQKTANTFGLYDMSGNVWEWCNDWYEDEYYGKSPASNPKGPSSGEYKALRGGCWESSPDDCTVSYRFSHEPDNSLNGVGFRLVIGK